MRLSGKVAVILGAGGGMGVEVVQHFIDEGAKVVAADIQIASLTNVISEPNIIAQADVTNKRELEALFQQAIKVFDKVDILVNLVGVAQPATPIEEITDNIWEKMISCNATSVFYSSQLAASQMKKQKSGVIVNVASISVERPRPGLSAYIASKGAAVAFSKALAIELAKDNIRVNVVNPGPTNTQMLPQFLAENTDTTLTEDDFKSSVPLGNLIHPVDIAKGIIYLCSDDAVMVTGEVLNIDGGRGI